MTRMPARRTTLVLAAAAFPAAASAAAWMIGDRSYRGAVEGGLDHAVDPLPVPPEVVTALGLAGLAVVLLLVWAAARVPSARAPLACWIVAGSLIGLGYRVLTAGVIGANIGAGLVLVLLGPVEFVVVVTALALTALRLTRRAHQP